MKTSRIIFTSSIYVIETETIYKRIAGRRYTYSTQGSTYYKLHTGLKKVYHKIHFLEKTQK